MTTVLNVRFFNQNDNEDWDGVSGSVQCAPTSYAALAYYLKPELFPASYGEPETFYKEQFDSLGYTASNRGDHSAHVNTLNKCFGISGSFTTAATLDKIKASLDAGYPVVLPLEYKDAGHVTLAVGYTDEGMLINDPYGIRSGSSNEWIEINDGDSNAGEKDLYAWSTLDAVAFCGSEHTWAYIVDKLSMP